MIAFFQSLSTDGNRKWWIYISALEKPGLTPLVYIGSGTSRIWGVRSRLIEYNKNSTKNQALPTYAVEARKADYMIPHKGPSCMALDPFRR